MFNKKLKKELKEMKIKNYEINNESEKKIEKVDNQIYEVNKKLDALAGFIEKRLLDGEKLCYVNNGIQKPVKINNCLGSYIAYKDFIEQKSLNLTETKTLQKIITDNYKKHKKENKK